MAHWLRWVSGCLVLLVLLLLDLRHQGWVARGDRVIFHWLAHRPRSRFWHVVAALGTPWLVVAYVLVLAGGLLVSGRWSLALWVLGTLGGGNVLGIITKRVLKRERPVGHPSAAQDYSFPSGHVLGVSLLALMLMTLWPRPLVIGLVGGGWLLVAGSRLFLRAHYPSDLGGTILFAAAWFILFTRVWGWLMPGTAWGAF